jgi:uncharacterized membrane protein (TIGR02234 family)
MAESGVEPRAGRGAGRSFGPTVLVGLAGAALTAVAASQRWAGASGRAAGADVSVGVTGSSSAPLAIALALVALATWGVVLVVRGRVRTVVAAVGVLASAGVLVATLVAFGRVRDDAAQALVARGGTAGSLHTSVGAWYVVCAVAAVVTLATFAVAVVASPHWPAMGSRYDAPGARAGSGGADPEAPAGELEMWRALDEGQDPTA